MIYEEIAPLLEGAKSFIKRIDESGEVWLIPTDSSNSDYQAYLEQLKEHK